MSQLYVVCEFGMETGRILTGTFHNGRLQVSETRRFPNEPLVDGKSVHWNIPELYEEVTSGLRSVGDFEEPVGGITCVSWPGSYLLFDAEGALMMPTFHHTDPRATQGTDKVGSSPEVGALFEETGTHPVETSLLFQLAAETPKRLKQAAYVLPIADGFNYLLSGVAGVESSMASASQLFNPASREWSGSLLRAAGVPSKVMPPIIRSGTVLGPLRPELAQATGLQDVNVVAGCSEQMASVLMGLPRREGENWGFLNPGKTTLMGCQVEEPVMSEEANELDFNNQLGYTGSVSLFKRTNGLGILEACVQFWDERNRGMDLELLSHLASSAPPFESLIDPADPRFLTPNDMPLKIQAFCKETNQPVPRKPGPVYRCILESLALMYRKMLRETQYVSGREIQCVYVLSGKGQSLLNHFISNALQLPIVIAPPDSAAIGNIVIQMLAQGTLKSVQDARALIRQSIKIEEVKPHASVWNTAYERFVALAPAVEPAA